MLNVKPSPNDKMVQKIQRDAKKGMLISDAIEKLSTCGVPITQSIRIIRIAYGISLAKAKKIVESHPVWKEMFDTTKPYHNELINHLHELSDEDSQKISSCTYTYIEKVCIHKRRK
jgi:ABC-type dipeptide/oligopeptide/nickel transport system ATPase component